MIRPAATLSESDVLVGFLDQQLTSLRASAYGLTDAQARETPCASSLSIGGLIKHATWIMVDRSAPQALDEAGFASFRGSFALTEDETLDGALGAFDAAREGYLAEVGATDPAAAMTAPPAPWDGLFEPTPSVQRFALVHHVEELARHAGHADIVREQLDGASAASLLMAVEGREGNDYVQPWKPNQLVS